MGKGYKKKRNKANNNNEQKSNKPRPEVGTVNNNYIQNVIDKGNFRFECYYALQGLHNYRYNDDVTDTTNGITDSVLIECTSDEERETERLLWRKFLGKILPASFRIGKDIPEYYKQSLTRELDDLLQKAQEYDANEGDETTIENNKLLKDPRAGPLKESATEIQTLSFCPYAYQLSGLDRATIRKNPALEQLHLWLKQQVAAGTITRQETVSMIPTTLLHVISTDVVLDMCAAPGSKTSQILEDLQCNVVVDSLSSSNDTTSSPTTTLGCLVANDASVPRACMLVSQLRRILHMHPVALITAVNAQFFPSDVIQFDKILCDVPCSGDGTTRKNINVWKTWSASGALALHSLQLSIAMKGAAQLLKTNGTMVYSTCSLNPIENEAVVAELLRQSNGALELVEYNHDTSSVANVTNGPIPGFRTRPGMTTWKVLCEDMTQRQQKNKEKKNNAKMRKKREEYAAMRATTTDPTTALPAMEVPIIDSVDASNNDLDQPQVNKQSDQSVVRRFAPEAWDQESLLQLAESEGLRLYKSMKEVPPNMNRRIRKSAFPPTTEEVEKFHLERCIRCLPQDNNTGGFFVALLRKVSSWSANDRRQERKTSKMGPVQAEAPTAELSESRQLKRPRNDQLDNDTNKTEDDDSTNEEEEEVDDLVPEESNVEDEMLEGLDDVDNIPNTKRTDHHPGEDFGKDDFAAVRDDIMDPLIEHYGLCNGFDKTLYMARACSESTVIYYVGKAVKQLFDLGIQKRLTIVNTGLKGFMRNNRNVADCAVTYRVCQEGVHFLVPYMTKRKYVVDSDDFRTCLLGKGETIHLSKFTDEFRTAVSALTPGSFVVILKGYEDDTKLDQKFLVCMWKCRGESIDSLVAKVEVDDLLSKLDAMQV